MKGKISCRYYNSCGGHENCSRCAERYSRKESQYRVLLKRKLRLKGLDYSGLNTLETEMLEKLMALKKVV